MRGRFSIIAGIVLLSAAATSAAPVKKKAPTPPKPAAAEQSDEPNCEARKFETTITMTGPDGQSKSSKVKMCGKVGQSDADWIRTLQDAVKKTSLSPQMPQAAKEQIIAAVNAEVDRLTKPALALPENADISKLAKSAPPKAEAPLSRDYGSLGAMPVATNVEPPHVLGPAGAMGETPRLTLRCALAGDEDRPSACDTIDRDTVMVLRADDAYPRGVEVRFVRKGDSRAHLALPAMKTGQTANLRLPPAVCAGVVRSRVEIQALGANSPSGAAAGTIGEYDLRC